MEIHHVTGGVVLEMNLPAQSRRQKQVLHGVFGGEKGRGQIVVAVFHLHLQAGIGDERVDQIAFDVGCITCLVRTSAPRARRN